MSKIADIKNIIGMNNRWNGILPFLKNIEMIIPVKIAKISVKKLNLILVFKQNKIKMSIYFTHLLNYILIIHLYYQFLLQIVLLLMIKITHFFTSKLFIASN